MQKIDEESGAPLIGNKAPEADLEQKSHRQMVRDRLKGLESGGPSAQNQVKEIVIEEPQGLDACLLYFFNCIFCLLFPAYLAASIQCLQPRMARVFISFGKIRRIQNVSGPFFFGTPCCTEIRDVSCAIETMQLRGSSVPDAKGSPMHVSAVLNYNIENAAAATFAVENLTEFLQNQGLEVLRKVCSQFPYKSESGEPSLMSDGKLIGESLRQLVQERVKIAGINVIKMELMEVSYHVEVAQSLLQIQQAQAKIDARSLIVKGAVSIVDQALGKLGENDIELNQQDRDDLISKLMVITCSDQGNA